jgi:site-specific recombinase XerD
VIPRGEDWQPSSSNQAQTARCGNYSAAYCRGARSALIFLYESVLKQRGKVCDLPRMKRPEQLPRILSREEIAKILR